MMLTGGTWINDCVVADTLTEETYNCILAKRRVAERLVAKEIVQRTPATKATWLIL